MDVGKNKGPQREINVTPLIDVVLVLLIIFMVLTPSMLKHLRAAVPKADEDSSAPAPAEILIMVEYTAKRELAVNNEPVAPEALGAKLTERLRGDRRKVVFFKADDEVLYGEVIRFMDIARGAGAQTLAIVTK
jgi:biopolymer transport protein ExbD